MKHIVLIAAILALIIPVRETRAQNLRSIMRQKLIEKALEEDAKEDSIKAVEEGREPDKSPNRTMDDVYLDAMGLKGNVPYESTYNFDAYMQMESSDYDRNGKLDEKLVYDSYISKESVDYAIVTTDKGDRSTIILDAKNHSMLVLNDSDGDKAGFAMNIDEGTVKDMAEEQEEEPAEVKNYAQYRTGKTKNILGYTCDEYLIDDETSEVHMWVSEKLGKEVRRNMLRNQQAFGTSYYYASGMDGVVMEYDRLDKEDGERSVMQVTAVDLNRKHSISTRDYTVMSMRQPAEESEDEEDTGEDE